MKTITVCVGSSCHMKGSHYAIDTLATLIDQYGLSEKVELRASFCMGNCTGNIGAEIDGRKISDMKLENVLEVFEREILSDERN